MSALVKPVKLIATKAFRPLLVKYLSKTRTYRYQGLSLQIPPQVFHPAFFFSTKLLLRYVTQHVDLKGKTFLELGAGSGLISFCAAQSGAIVTASDINKTAIKFLHSNNIANSLEITIVQSDLFDNIGSQTFDIIAINPPYYKKQPQNDADYAWYCGENGEYFKRLFSQLHNYLNPQTTVLMVLSEDCDLTMIKQFASEHNYEMETVFTERIWWEQNYIFQLQLIT